MPPPPKGPQSPASAFILISYHVRYQTLPSAHRRAETYTKIQFDHRINWSSLTPQRERRPNTLTRQTHPFRNCSALEFPNRPSTLPLKKPRPPGANSVLCSIFLPYLQTFHPTLPTKKRTHQVPAKKHVLLPPIGHKKAHLHAAHFML